MMSNYVITYHRTKMRRKYDAGDYLSGRHGKKIKGVNTRQYKMYGEGQWSNVDRTYVTPN